MSNQILEIRLSPKGIKPVRNGHPWVFRNALAGRPKPAVVSADAARTVTGNGVLWKTTAPAIVCDPSGTPLGWGIYNEASRLALRMITRNPSLAIHRGTFTALIRDALSRRSGLEKSGDTDVYRLLFGEADGFPGLAVDRLGDTLVIEISGAFAWENRAWIVEDLTRLSGLSGTVIVPDREMLDRDGIPGPLETDNQETASPEAPPHASPLTVRENGLAWYTDPGVGQKTGFYCDQRDNRRRVADLARGCTVLDAFCYHGGFGLTALNRGAARVTCADSSVAALTRVEENSVLQGVTDAADRLNTLKGDIFTMLRNNEVGEGGLDQFDLVILDPPKLAPARHHREAGLRAYKDLNLSAMRKMKAGSQLVTFSCSGAVSREDFRTALAWAAADAGRIVRIEEVLSQGPDHPVPLHFPEAEYLKGYVLRIG